MLFCLLSALFCRISSADISHILGNLEEISTFQQMLVQSLEEHTKLVCQSSSVHKMLYTYNIIRTQTVIFDCPF